MKNIFVFLLVAGFISSNSILLSQSTAFYAYYTRLAYNDNNNTGKYADIVVNVSKTGKLVFSREYSYLPYWEVKSSKQFFQSIIPITGDGPEERPDRINKSSYVRVVENSKEKIIIHWRYAPDQNSLNFTDFKKSYEGDIGRYFADYVDEYFIIDPSGSVTRKVKKGCYSLDEWNDPMNVITQELKLTPDGIETINNVPAELQNLPGQKISGSAVIDKEKRAPALWWKFDEGLGANHNYTVESNSGFSCKISGVDSYWRAGVSGSSLSFDGYTSKVSMAASELPHLTENFSIEAWIAPQEYPWNWSGIVDHDQDKKAGYSLSINHKGKIGLHACIDGSWVGLVTNESVELLKWTCITGVYRKDKGFSIYFNGELVGTNEISGSITDATNHDLYIGMAHEQKPPWAFERNITKSYLSNMVFSGLIDEVRLFERALDRTEIESGYQDYKPENSRVLDFWVLPAGDDIPNNFGATYTRLKCSPEWDGLWRYGDYADIVVSFDDKPSRFVFWRGTNYLPSIVTEPGPKGIWNSDQGPEDYTDQCYEHMSDKTCRYSHVRLIENTEARVVVHWRNASVGVSYDWLSIDEDGWGLWTDEYWYIYPDAVSVRYQVSGRLKDFKDIQTQQNELLSQPGTRPEDIVPYDAITVSNIKGETEDLNYSTGVPYGKGPKTVEERNLIYMNLNSEFKHFNIGEIGSYYVPYSQWESMRMAPGHTKYNAWNHYPFGLLPSDGTVATGIDRVSSSCIGTLYGLHHKLDDGRTDMYNLYGITNLPAKKLKDLNRSWNFAPALSNISGAEGNGYEKGQRAYVLTRESNKISFNLDGSDDSPILNPCFVIKNWESDTEARIKINGNKQTADSKVRQGIIRDTDGTRSLVIWIEQKSDKKASYDIY
ncbi:MAG: LamG domain-containing protein [Bacteroidetes bacterium]|nr:LamG domain-containing protein [Bacteroidota bacterium]